MSSEDQALYCEISQQILNELQKLICTKITEVNYLNFVYSLFYEDLSPLIKINLLNQFHALYTLILHTTV